MGTKFRVVTYRAVGPEQIAVLEEKALEEKAEYEEKGTRMDVYSGEVDGVVNLVAIIEVDETATLDEIPWRDTGGRNLGELKEHFFSQYRPDLSVQPGSTLSKVINPVVEGLGKSMEQLKQSVQSAID